MAPKLGGQSVLSTFLKAKIHHATVTGVELDYEGSLTIDPELMDAVGMRPYEKILVANLANGERFETYAIAAERGSRAIILNGATAHKGSIGDRVIIFTFCRLTDAEIETHKPRVLLLGEGNDPAT
jgi:aspartate 1-decarboxylase